MRPFFVSLALVAAGMSGARAEDASTVVGFASTDESIKIEVGGRPFATYVFSHDEIRRPFFSDVFSPEGQRLTRNLPPIEGQDATDHPTMHPGIWLAFGDLGGVDFWRHEGVARHVEFVKPPRGGAAGGDFTVRNRYERGEQLVCEEICSASVLVRPTGYLLLLDSTFTASDDAPGFGDQEEMGLGARVATPLTVPRGGRILNSAGGQNEREVWGQPADWCDYRGAIDGQPAGLLIMPDPRNFRRSWFHARDYGLLVANPFGQRAFTGGQASKVEIPSGGELRLRFGVLAYSGAVDAAEAYQDFLKVRESPR
jgi:hypothetical protein